MGYWQTLLLLYPLSVIGFRAAAWSYWRLHKRHSGEQAPGWGEALSASWYSTAGAAIALLLYQPSA